MIGEFLQREFYRNRISEYLVCLANAMVWTTGALFMFDNLGFRISTVIAGLGIGGIEFAYPTRTLHLTRT